MLNVYKFYDKSRELSRYNELGRTIDQLEVLGSIDSIEGYDDDEYEEKMDIYNQMSPRSLQPLMPIIKRSASYAYNYAKHMLGEKRWPDVEPVIMQNAEYAYLYAHDVIKGRWPEAEPHIMKDSHYAYRYAKDIIKGRWSEAEKYIMKESSSAYYYANDIIKGRFPEAEKYIMKDAVWAFNYSANIIKGRWLEAEPRIKTFPSLWSKYKKEFNINE